MLKSEKAYPVTSIITQVVLLALTTILTAYVVLNVKPSWNVVLFGTLGVLFTPLMRYLFSTKNVVKFLNALKRTSRTVKSSHIEKNIHPGKISILVAGILHGPQDRQFVLGCIEERYRADVAIRGSFFAKSMIWRDNICAFWSATGNFLVKVLKYSVGTALFGKLAHFIYNWVLR